MGATTFEVKVAGKSAEEAFKAAVKSHLHEYGRGGYTGTIAEKKDFTVIPVPKDQDAVEFARELVDSCDPRVDDKWGPAGCVELGPSPKDPTLKLFFFFGWASD